MYIYTGILKEREKQLVQYLEKCTTEEILKEVNKNSPSPHVNSDIHLKLKNMKIPQPVMNALIICELSINKGKTLTHKMLVLAEHCKKYNIKDAQDAITFFKQYYSS